MSSATLSPRRHREAEDSDAVKAKAIEILQEQERSGLSGPQKRENAINALRGYFPGTSALLIGVVVDLIISGINGDIKLPQTITDAVEDVVDDVKSKCCCVM